MHLANIPSILLIMLPFIVKVKNIFLVVCPETGLDIFNYNPVSVYEPAGFLFI